MNETVKKLRAILLDMINRQLKNETGISTRINLYMVEVQLLKDVIITIAGADAMDKDSLHDWACDLVDSIHKEFDCWEELK